METQDSRAWLLESKVKKEVISGYTESFDGTWIWFRTKIPLIERKYPPLVLCNGIGTTISYWRYVEEYISNFTQVVVWDYRGHMRSAVKLGSSDVSMQANAKDMKAVCDELGIKRAIFGGFSMGVQVILEFYRLFEDMVEGLIPALGPYGTPASFFLDFPLSAQILQGVSKIVFLTPDRAKKIWSKILNLPFAFNLGKKVGLISERLFFLNPLLARAEDFVEYFENLQKMDITLFFKMAVEAQKHSAEDILEKIKVPTLIIVGENDIFTPKWVMLKMWKKIPNAELLILPKGSHGGLVEYAELVCLRIEKFLKDHWDKTETVEKDRKSKEENRKRKRKK